MNPLDIRLTNAEKAIAYGYALDRNDMNSIYSLFSPDVAYYHFDNGMKRGPIEVCRFIKEKRTAHREALDEITWAQSYITPVSEDIILVHFSCDMKAQGGSFTHHCTQRLYFNDKGQVNMIDFIDEPAEIRAMNAFMIRSDRSKKRA